MLAWLDGLQMCICARWRGGQRRMVAGLVSLHDCMPGCMLAWLDGLQVCAGGRRGKDGDHGSWTTHNVAYI
eukprot:363324-Chlamydomonas_euryale.AAC.26